MTESYLVPDPCLGLGLYPGSGPFPSPGFGLDPGQGLIPYFLFHFLELKAVIWVPDKTGIEYDDGNDDEGKF